MTPDDRGEDGPEPVRSQEEVESSGPEHDPDRPSPQADLETVTEVAAPSWLRQPETLSVVKYRSQDREASYTTVVPGEFCEVDPSHPFRQLTFDLVGLGHMERAKVTTQFETVEGTTRRTFRFTNGEFGPERPLEVSHRSATPAQSATVRIHGEYGGAETDDLNAVGRQNDRRRSDGVPSLGLPRPSATRREESRTRERLPPIILVSIDTLRYDLLDELSPVIKAMGGSSTVPSEPRTQAHWTPPSHGSMFTGVYPGDHHYLGNGHGADHPLHPNLETLGSFLTDQGYSCNGVVSHTRILPEVGFGRGFRRFELQNMTNWFEREKDAQTAVDQVLKWIRQAETAGNRAPQFYFLHVFDAHYPYIPPTPTRCLREINLKAVDEVSDELTRRGGPRDLLKTLSNGLDIDPATTEMLRTLYRASVRYVARQVKRLLNSLKRHGVFDEALVIVTGDHGEEFGRRNTYTHNTLHDAVIRPFMSVSPPASAAWSVPENADIIDIFPSIARTVGVTIPEQCRGTAWQRDNIVREPRIAERILPDWYCVSVEVDGVKGIFTYETNFPYRPSESQITEGPERSDFYRTRDVRRGTPENGKSIATDTRRELLDIAEWFLRRKPVTSRFLSPSSMSPTQEVVDRLRYLGYAVDEDE